MSKQHSLKFCRSGVFALNQNFTLKWLCKIRNELKKSAQVISIARNLPCNMDILLYSSTAKCTMMWAISVWSKLLIGSARSRCEAGLVGDAWAWYGAAASANGRRGHVTWCDDVDSSVTDGSMPHSFWWKAIPPMAFASAFDARHMPLMLWWLLTLLLRLRRWLSSGFGIFHVNSRFRLTSKGWKLGLIQKCPNPASGATSVCQNNTLTHFCIYISELSFNDFLSMWHLFQLVVLMEQLKYSNQWDLQMMQIQFTGSTRIHVSSWSPLSPVKPVWNDPLWTDHPV